MSVVRCTLAVAHSDPDMDRLAQELIEREALPPGRAGRRRGGDAQRPHAVRGGLLR